MTKTSIFEFLNHVFQYYYTVRVMKNSVWIPVHQTKKWIDKLTKLMKKIKKYN